MRKEDRDQKRFLPSPTLGLDRHSQALPPAVPSMFYYLLSCLEADSEEFIF